MKATLLLLVGCTGGTESSPPPANPLDGGWADTVAQQPEQFARLVDGAARPGWVAFHKADYPDAARQFQSPSVPFARALLEQAAFEDDLSRLAHHAWPATFTAWEQRAGLPGGSAIPMVAALAAADAGDIDAMSAWLAKGGAYAAAGVDAVARSLADSGGLASPVGDSMPGACIAAHLEARRTADLAPLEACGTGPLVVEAGESHQRELYDPLAYTTLATVHRARAEQALAAAADPPSGLDALVFSSTWTDADLAAERARDPTLATAGASGPTLAALGLDQASADDDPQWARDRVRDLDSKLDPWLASRLDGEVDDGKALMTDLDLVAVYRSRVLLAWARQALVDDHPEQARAFAQLGLDVEHGSEIGPRNPPGLFAVLAEANLRTGHTREALDALQPLIEPYPAVAGLDETIGDLAILQGLDRQGDSKEN